MAKSIPYPPMAKSIPKPIPEQNAIGKKLRRKLHDHIKSENRRGGITFMGPKGVGKTCIVGEVHSKAPKDEKTLNLFAACKTDHADKQAEDVGVATGCKPLTLGRLPAVKTALESSASATFTITPTSFGNLLNPGHSLHEKCITTLKASKVTCIRLTLDEAHKASRTSRPGLPRGARRWRSVK